MPRVHRVGSLLKRRLFGTHQVASHHVPASSIVGGVRENLGGDTRCDPRPSRRVRRLPSEAVLRVCENCCEWMEEIVISGEPAVVCPHLGHHRPFLRLPLFQVTGSSAAGKSRVCRDLPAALPECVLDQDILLSGLPWEQHRRNWLRVAMNIHQGARSTVLIETQLPEHYEQLPERVWFDEIHYLALVCDSAKLGERLSERPAWRGVTDERIVEMQSFNEWLKANAATTSPPMTLLDTTDADPSETVTAVAAWVRNRLAAAAPIRANSL
jgi:hypothetical protein